MRISNAMAVSLLLLSAGAAVAVAPPVAEERPVVETHFGTRTTDPYRYFEDVKQPQVMTFLKAEAAYAEGALASLPGRQKMFERVKALSLDSGDALVGLTERPTSIKTTRSANGPNTGRSFPVSQSASRSTKRTATAESAT